MENNIYKKIVMCIVAALFSVSTCLAVFMGIEKADKFVYMFISLLTAYVSWKFTKLIFPKD